MKQDGFLSVLIYFMEMLGRFDPFCSSGLLACPETQRD